MMIDLKSTIIQNISHLTINSNEVRQGSTFVAIKGEQFDGHNFIEQALNNGAKNIICQKIPINFKKSDTFIKVKDSRLAYSMIQEAMYNFPSKKMHLIAVTGTNGKTTVVHILQQLLGNRCSSISTLGIKFNNELHPTDLTTPDAAIIQQNLFELLKKDCQSSIIETSAHALSQKRLGNMQFDYTIFTNLSQDHLDFYKEMKSYFEAKSLLFSQHLQKFGLAIINGDDEYGKILCKRLPRHKYLSFGQQKNNDIKMIIKPLELSIKFCQKYYTFKHNFIGEYNAYNLTAAIIVACLKNIPTKVIEKQLLHLFSCSGRLQQIDKHNIFVDYAHTPAALENILKAFMGSNKIHLIFGCGGNRDKSKRSLMGQIAEKYANIITLTDDNPRQENSLDIINDIMNGINQKEKVKIIPNRYQAISEAIDNYDSKITLIIAGKGHEEKQIYQNESLHFNDFEVASKLLNNKK